MPGILPPIRPQEDAAPPVLPPIGQQSPPDLGQPTPAAPSSILGNAVPSGQPIAPEQMHEAKMKNFGEHKEALQNARMQHLDAMSNLDWQDPNYSQKLMKLGTQQRELHKQHGELQQLEAEEKMANPWGTPGNHPGILGKIGHGLATVGNVAGAALAPSLTAAIPGSKLNLQAQAAQGKAEEEAAGKEGKQAAETAALTNPPEKATDWEVKEGQNAEGQPIMFRVNRATGETRPLEGIVPKPAGGTAAPLGDRIPQLNHLLASRFEIMNPGQTLPPEYTLPENATQQDYDRIEKALSSHENAVSNQMQRDQLREMRKQTMQLASQKHDTEQDAIDAAAKALASGNLTNLRDIASMRGSQRLLIFQRALELNPNFNTSEITRKIRMMDNYQNGAEGRQLQSFGTFLEHAGELKRASEAMERNHAALLNKPLTWWKANMADDPVFRQYLVALEPVGKEFESFLLAGRALYEDDRKQIKTLMDENTPVKSVNAAASQMAKTAYDRYNEMAHRYKQTLKHDLRDDVDPFSPEAEQAARDLDLNLDPQGKGKDNVTGNPPPGATMKVPGSDGKLHWSDGKKDLGLAE